MVIIRHLNSKTVANRYPWCIFIPSHINSIHVLAFSKIDLKKAYYHVPVAQKDIEKTAVTTPFGLRISKNAAQSFQRYMDDIFRDVACVFIYIDDILIFSKDEQSHIHDLRQVLDKLDQHALKVNLEKCQFNCLSLTFLGHEVNGEGIKPLATKVDAISKMDKPTDYSGLRRFMGMIGFYCRFIPRYAELSYPLYDLLSSYDKEPKTFEWTKHASAAFETVKTALTNYILLHHPSPQSETFHLVTDASRFAIGSTLHQVIDGIPHPLSFYSRKLMKTEQSYSTFDRELLAAYSAILHFKNQVEGRNVTLFTDHKPLVSAFTSPQSLKSDRQQRHMSFIAEFVSQILYIKGEENIVADTLSRNVNSVQVDTFDLLSIANLQATDQETKDYLHKLKPFPLTNDSLSIYCDMSVSTLRPFLPKGI